MRVIIRGTRDANGQITMEAEADSQIPLGVANTHRGIEITQGTCHVIFTREDWTQLMVMAARKFAGS